jgi:hypothetical protein
VAGFDGYLCWTADGATALPTEAVVASRALFFATHAPLKIYRSDPNGKRTDVAAKPVNEETVWQDFLHRKTSGGVLLMPVIGESGTGKSHLVRWVKEKTPSTDKREVIYLPKSKTSLKEVVKALLARVGGAELDQLRADVDRMSSGLDQAALERRLVNQLQEALAAAPMESGPARVLSGKVGLQVLLQDPYVSDHLLRPGALIPQMAKSILKDRAEDEKDRPLEFTIEDLPLDVGDARQAAAVTQKMLQLLGARPELQGTAVRMLNDHVQLAVANATSIGAGRLQSAMLEVRREFSQQGKEIILLIEDFAVIQGFQRDLLDALIEVGDRDGRSDLASIRTLMAVTTGYYESLPDTVLTRVRAATGYVYDLDVQFDPSAGMSETSSFVGRYLNAARIGLEEVEKNGERGGESVPNACDLCAFRGQCHDAFGRTDKGHGLYPFNESALRRAIHARPAPGADGAFNPRVVIGEVVRKVLVEHARPIADGEFPDERFAEEYRARRPGEVGYSTDTREKILSAATRSVLNDLDPDNSDRRATFLEFWGDAPDTVVNLSPGIHQAFELSPLKVDVAKQKKPPTQRPASSSPVSRSHRPINDTRESVKRAIDSVESWATQEAVLDQDVASNIREIIRTAIMQRGEWNNPPMPEPTLEVLRRAWPVASSVVSIEGALGERETVAGATPIRLLRSPENAVFFEGLLLRAKGGDVQAGAEAWRRLAWYAERYQSHLQRYTIRHLAVTEDQLTLGVLASLIGATLAGRALPGMTEADLLSVVFDDGQTWDRKDVESRAPSWQTTLQRHRAARPDLVAGLRSGLGVARGVSGKVRMIDAARALPMLRDAVKSWRWAPPNTELAPWIQKAVIGLADWESLLDAQLARLTSELANVRKFLPSGTSLAETIQAVEAASLNARETGADQLGQEKYEQLRGLIGKAKEQDKRAVERLEGELANALDPAQRDRARIFAAATDQGSDITLIAQFLAASDQWLTSALAAARKQQSGAQEAAEGQVRELLGQWTALSEEASE